MRCWTCLLKCEYITGANLIKILYNYDNTKRVYEVLLLSSNLEVIKKYQTEDSEDAEKCYKKFWLGAAMSG